ncbi:MAG TPA: RNA methyltransferase substrate-binding domain-containing protein, partial [Conexibacter sp.]|nr:RNA methyltransferase substrate-binding domain-containing protein [Conexibacter sp.]
MPAPRHRAERASPPAGAMVLYGRNAVREALRGPRAVRQVWATERAAREPWLRGATVHAARGEQLEARCGSPDHQGICAEVAPYGYADADELLAREEALIVALDEIQDPQNLGAICRTAECAGATGV